MSSHVHPAPVVESNIVFNPFIHDDFSAKVARWKQLLFTCYGPHGTQVMIQNALGGHVVVTSSAIQIINSVQASHPLVKILMSLVKGHCKAYGDYGLFCSLLGLSLISSPVTVELPLSLVTHVRSDLFEIVAEHLNSDCHHCKLRVDTQNIKQLLEVVRAILRTKTECVLSANEIQYIATVILQSFFTSIPATTIIKDEHIKLGQTHFIKLEGMSPLHSKQFSGLLHPTTVPAISNVYQLGPNKKIALFNTSLCGDTSEAPAAEFILTECSTLIEDCVWLQLQNLSDALVKLKINVLGCQKVVHPSLIKLLEKKGIFTLDRLGEDTFSLLSSLTGGVPISCLEDNICETQLGKADIEEVNLYGKCYLCFKRQNCTLSSILLCHIQEECVIELQTACQQSLFCLKGLLSSPKAFVGAGCLEIHLASIVHYKVSKRIQDGDVYMDISGKATPAQVEMILKDFMSILFELGKKLHPNWDQFLTDTEFGHLWPRNMMTNDPNVRCACGLLTSEMLKSDLVELELQLPNRSQCALKRENGKELFFMEGCIMDTTIPKFAAYRSALEISSLLLKVGFFIVDQN